MEKSWRFRPYRPVPKNLWETITQPCSCYSTTPGSQTTSWSDIFLGTRRPALVAITREAPGRDKSREERGSALTRAGLVLSQSSPARDDPGANRPGLPPHLPPVDRQRSLERACASATIMGNSPGVPSPASTIHESSPTTPNEPCPRCRLAYGPCASMYSPPMYSPPRIRRPLSSSPENCKRSASYSALALSGMQD